MVSKPTTMTWLPLDPVILLMVLSIPLTCWLGDACVSLAPYPSWRRAIVDSAAHGVVALLSWTVVTWPGVSWRLAALAGVIGAGIDLDHVLMAGAFDINKVIHLPSRPPLHCSTPLLAVAVPLLARGRGCTCAALVLTAVLSHHLRDANRRGLWLWPAGSTAALPTPLYLSAEVLLVLVVRWILRSSMGRTQEQLPLVLAV